MNQLAHILSGLPYCSSSATIAPAPQMQLLDGRLAETNVVLPQWGTKSGVSVDGLEFNWLLQHHRDSECCE